MMGETGVTGPVGMKSHRMTRKVVITDSSVFIVYYNIKIVQNKIMFAFRIKDQINIITSVPVSEFHTDFFGTHHSFTIVDLSHVTFSREVLVVYM